jgi:hypothetical protein
LKWYFQDVLIIFSAVTIAGYCLNAILPHSDSRWWQIGAAMGFGFFVMLAGACVSSVVWLKTKMWLEQWQMSRERLY